MSHPICMSYININIENKNFKQNLNRVKTNTSTALHCALEN
jgi:hypothetical protein